jgi:hypothetical protein
VLSLGAHRAVVSLGATVVLYGNGGGGTDEFRLRGFCQAGAFNARIIGFISTVSEDTKGNELAILILARLVTGGRLVPQTDDPAGLPRARRR